ncbi:MAG: hypothetical protein OXF79_15945 [Chloroflexi bacterium]|nr:hypothetical protein [Chloroflexota bacterium]
MTLELTFAVQKELERADQLRYEAVERAQYEAELAMRRYLRVDPDHRLVADTRFAFRFRRVSVAKWAETLEPHEPSSPAVSCRRGICILVRIVARRANSPMFRNAMLRAA